MATKKPKGLGRGLEALLGPRRHEPFAPDEAAEAAPTVLPLDELVPGAYQPRLQMDEGALYELAESIKAQGVLQPVLVRRLHDGPHSGKYEIIAGERRFRASGLAGLSSVPVLVREVSDETAAAIALIENLQREDLNPIEQAQGLQRLISDFGYTHEEAAQAVGRSRSGTSNLLRLLQLTEPVRTMLMAGDLDMGHARALLALDQGGQIVAANQIAAKKMTVREAERLVKQTLEQARATPGVVGRGFDSSVSKSADLVQLEEELSDLLAASVQVRMKGRLKGKSGSRQPAQGELAIAFGSLDALDGLIERLRRSA